MIIFSRWLSPEYLRCKSTNELSDIFQRKEGAYKFKNLELSVRRKAR